MPSPAVIAGLVVGAVIGFGLLCVGIYFVHRYMDLQCRKISSWFRYNSLVFHKGDNVDPGKEDQGADRDDKISKKKGKQGIRSMKPREAEDCQWNQKCVAKLRGRDGYDDWQDSVQWADGQQMQLYNPRATSAQLQALGIEHRQAIEWSQQQSLCDRGWYPPAVFQRAGTHGTCYACVPPPRPDVMTAHQQPPFWYPSLYGGEFGLDEQYQDGDAEAQQTGARPRPGSEAASKAWLKAESVFIKRDCVQVVERHPSVIEDAKKDRDRRSGKRKEKKKKEMAKQASATESTISSGEAVPSNKAVPRDTVLSGAPRRTRFMAHCYQSYPQHPNRSAQAWHERVRFAQQSSRREERQGLDTIRDV